MAIFQLPIDVHIFAYADNIHLFAHSGDRMDNALDKLKDYFEEIGLILNPSKSQRFSKDSPNLDSLGTLISDDATCTE